MSILKQLIQENKELREKIAELERELKKANDKIAELEKVLVEKKTPSFVKLNNNHQHKKTGQKNGHEGYTRHIPERIDDVKELKISRCPY